MGVLFSFFAESHLRNIVFDLYQWTTNGGIQFRGKLIFYYASPFYYLSFGLITLLLIIDFSRQSSKKMRNSGLMWLLIFVFTLVACCTLDAHFKILECTNCDNGVRVLGYSKVNYGLILGFSILLSGIPSLVRVGRYSFPNQVG